MTSDDEIDRRYQSAKSAIKRAGELTWHYFTLGVATEIKKDQSPVTVADRESETLLRGIFSEEFPGDGFVGEEHGEEPSTTGFRWIIDPIDATANFVRHIPIYGNLIGLEYEGKIVAGLCYVPAMRELYHARKGYGAFKNDQAIHVSSVAALADAQFCYPELRMFERRGLGDFFLEVTRGAKRSRGFGDYWNFLLVAEGAADLVIEPTAAVWDLAALQPIVEEAGGVFTDFEGKASVWGGGAIAANPSLHREIMQRLAKHQQ
ncbi:histidinol phosphate phosphatase [bacterium]|nr:histidinol phosphate phosphatase [bacterium]